VIGGERTSADAVERAMAFYAAIGKRPIHVKREVKGHIANRLQAALWREAFHLVDQGVASVADIDTAISQGPGLRWAVMGPFMNLHLSGGAGGIAHVLAHLGGPIEDWWKDLGSPLMTAQLKQQVTEGVAAELGERHESELERMRDTLLLNLIRAKSASGTLE
jgi:3-hydroxyacyl-CoA dehydrogenase